MTIDEALDFIVGILVLDPDADKEDVVCAVADLCDDHIALEVFGNTLRYVPHAYVMKRRWAVEGVHDDPALIQ